MFDCPYCHHLFTTKQRLISHLSRNNKCYDVKTVGVPPILLDLMGFNQGEKEETPVLASAETNEKRHTSIINPKNIEPDPNLIVVPSDAKKDTYVCVNCQKIFVSQKNLDKHMATVKCRRKDVIVEDDKLSVIFKSKAENKKIVRPPKPPKNENVPQTKDYQGQQQNIKYIVKENYVDSLTDMMGSQDVAFKFIRTCIQTKIRGGINLLYKLYFEGKDYKDYPIEIVDAKAKKIYYKTPDKIALDENATHVKTILIENLRNCYLQFCNHIISANLEDNDVIFDDYDLAEIQNHILELSDDKKKDRIIVGLIEQTKK